VDKQGREFSTAGGRGAGLLLPGAKASSGFAIVVHRPCLAGWFWCKNRVGYQADRFCQAGKGFNKQWDSGFFTELALPLLKP